MISPQSIQEVTNRIDILDVVGEYVQLKKRGANYLGLCPFHGEKSPSFTVSPAKEIFKCFGCGKSGNAITFLMEHDHISYIEAIRWLANRYNIELEETEVSDEVKQSRLVSDSLYIANQFAQKFFTNQLINTDEGRNIARSYLYERGFSDQTIDTFQLGYNPNDRDIFHREASKEQFNDDILLKTGLVSKWQSGQIVDNYRGRVIFPVHNINGKILGFGARFIGKPPEKSIPKYINTPENEIYVKSKILYGIFTARNDIGKLDECLLVEGYTDVISLYQAGVQNVVSSGGTSLTMDQLRLIKKYTNNLTIIYDGDAAGIKAALRGLDMALEQSMNVQLVLIPDNEDPDSYVRKVGAPYFRDFIAANKKDIIFFQLEVMLKDAGNDIGKRNEVVNHIAETLSKIDRVEDFTKQQDYIRQCAAFLKIGEEGLTTLVNKYKRDRLQKENYSAAKKTASDPFSMPDMSAPTETDIATPTIAKDFQQEKNLVRILFEFGSKEWEKDITVADFIFTTLEDFDIEDPILNEMVDIYQQQYIAGQAPTIKDMMYHEDEKIRNAIIDFNVSPYALSDHWKELTGNKLHPEEEEDHSHDDILKSVVYFKLRKIKGLLKEIESEMQSDNADSDRLLQLLKVYKTLKEEEKAMTEQLGTVIFK